MYSFSTHVQQYRRIMGRVSRQLLCALFCLLMTQCPGLIQARNVNSELMQIKKERQQLAAERHSLEAKLGGLSRQLRQLDQAWVAARKSLQQVLKEKSKLDGKIVHLRQRISTLSTDIEVLRVHMRDEAEMAWLRAGRDPSWLDVLAGISVTEIPHRRYMLASLLRQQEDDRQVLQQSVQALMVLREDLQQQQVALAQVQKRKAVVEKRAKTELRAKRKLARTVRKNVDLKKSRDATLALQEKGLQRLLKRIREQAKARKRAARQTASGGGQKLAAQRYTIKGHIRRHKGKIPWPIRGKVVARYGAKLDANRPKLKGVLIAPSSSSRKGKKVRAIADGIVRYADWFGGFGLMMIVEHSDGIMSIYAHNDALYKKTGERVHAGDALSDVGSTGWVERTRLYFEMRDRGKVTNPARWCRR